MRGNCSIRETCLRQVLILLLSVSLLQAGEAWKMARWGYYPGKQELGSCYPYAVALHKDLIKHGYKAYIIGYHWVQNGQSGTHCVVIFKDEGRLYVIDNQTERPTWVDGKTDYDRLNQFTKGQATITEVEVL